MPLNAIGEPGRSHQVTPLLGPLMFRGVVCVLAGGGRGRAV